MIVFDMRTDSAIRVSNPAKQNGAPKKFDELQTWVIVLLETVDPS